MYGQHSIDELSDDVGVDLESLRALPESDQQVFLVGRIATDTTSMDAALRFVNAALRGRNDIDAFLDAPDFFSSNVKQTQQLAREHPEITDELRRAVLQAIKFASELYTRRNRYIHDMLRRNLLDHSWELTRLSRQPDGSETQKVDFDDTVALILDLVAATWRLRGCALNVLNGSWNGMTYGAVEGAWDGSATYVR